MFKRILIADDEPTVVTLVEQKLKECGYEVEIARNGREAWEIIQARPVDLIVLDVIMPVMSGVEVYKELKKNPRTAKIPVIIITDNRIFRESFQTLGVEHFLPKPLDGDKLLHKVEYVFTCADLALKNRQALVLSPDRDINLSMAKVLEENGMIVGKSAEPIEFISNALILSPRLILLDLFMKGDIHTAEIIRALSSFVRLADAKILVFIQFSPEAVGSVNVLEQIKEAKNDCLEAGAHKYIGRFSPDTFWEMVREFVD